MYRVIGLMSGTSLDGVDAALIETDGEAGIRFGPGAEHPYAGDQRRTLQEAVNAAIAWQFDGAEPGIFKSAEEALTDAHAAAIGNVLAMAGLTAADIDLIGFHGQTVLHRAPSAQRAGATRQLGDGRALAEAVGIDVVYDFRTADVASGGHGAPLATLYHEALFRRDSLPGPIAVLNLGGVANVSWLGDGDPKAFDTGPASGLLDAWCEQTIDRPFDRNGELAAKGKVDEAALAQLMAHPYFPLPPPKSLDRWDFSLDPVQGLSPEDGAATLTAFTARTVAEAIAGMGQPQRVLATGGGRKNPVMMAAIAAQLGRPAEPVEAVGWNGDLMEAQAFAWLAVRSLKGWPLSLPSTTGVPQPMTGGKLAKAG
ncbi:anhydro-N-acetylmuramic acid kinase [Hyphobacterium sp. HN65]|uniref:Anhydro-N-acetylmuramic acid kinase n=1 Tax=Hyphobacterium lacteum TaxID=3116575 RepID=A0ABU7LLM9_9PROT|nr:anhydro-N-acetylmuramic acid kinase [Hyphobacterium sp. HN65]MEE2524825.1 anhydro-N-acetylmuramic acid kinase [Hyphobacterium sp. HN65]